VVKQLAMFVVETYVINREKKGEG